MSDASNTRQRLLIEEWLPIAEIGIESIREAGAAQKPTPNRLHVWWARRPLVASRAAILASLLPADADHSKFMHMLGIHGDPIEAKKRIVQATKDNIILGKDAYGYRRAFMYTPNHNDYNHLCKTEYTDNVAIQSSVLDPTAGGGSIPFESFRLRFITIANDINPVAWLILKATVEFPAKYGKKVLNRFQDIGEIFRKKAIDLLDQYYPKEPILDCVPDGYLWARTISCPYCGGIVPLSPNWRLDSKGKGVKIVTHGEDPQNRHCTFEIVDKVKDQSAGTVKNGDALCPFSDCGRVIKGDEIKGQAQAGKMGEQLYTVVYKQTIKVGTTKAGKDKVKSVRGYRAPRPEDDVSAQVAAALAAKMPEWRARNIIPDEEINPGQKTDEPRRSGIYKWTDMFGKRQLLGHCTSVEVFHDLVDEIRSQNGGDIPELDKAAMCYLAIAMDKLLNYNSSMSVWMPTREIMANTFNRHDFAFCWSHAEMAPTITGLGYDWTIEQTGKALKELIELTSDGDDNSPLLRSRGKNNDIKILHGSADSLDIPDQSIDCIVMDPPYYDNVMYAELSDFFYVWLKRTAGLLFPEPFSSVLTDKDREAVANPAKFKGQKGGAKNLAGRDYQDRMRAIFQECRRVIKPHGVMTVMFTHKASGAWDALASALVKAGFVITASWPVNTESDSSLHIREKSAAKSTIFLVCRPREDRSKESDTVYWEDVEPLVAGKVRERVEAFQKAGIGGVDLYLASFGPALQVFSENWPLNRGKPITRPRDLVLLEGETFDPYAVRPEDALDAARREVKKWRMSRLATIERKRDLDPLTEWYLLAWDAFRAPRFPVDEALKLARVVGLDFDSEVKNVVAEVKSSDVILWDSMIRKGKGKLGPIGEVCMLDTLHRAASIVREQNTGAAKQAIEDNGLIDDGALMTALQAMLNVLPAISTSSGSKIDVHLEGASSDFEALEKLRALAFTVKVPKPDRQMMLTIFEREENDDDDESE